MQSNMYISNLVTLSHTLTRYVEVFRMQKFCDNQSPFIADWKLDFQTMTVTMLP